MMKKVRALKGREKMERNEKKLSEGGKLNFHCFSVRQQQIFDRDVGGESLGWVVEGRGKVKSLKQL